jgi:hypothetical protein
MGISDEQNTYSSGSIPIHSSAVEKQIIERPHTPCHCGTFQDQHVAATSQASLYRGRDVGIHSRHPNSARRGSASTCETHFVVVTRHVVARGHQTAMMTRAARGEREEAVPTTLCPWHPATDQSQRGAAVCRRRLCKHSARLGIQAVARSCECHMKAPNRRRELDNVIGPRPIQSARPLRFSPLCAYLSPTKPPPLSPRLCAPSMSGPA